MSAETEKDLTVTIVRLNTAPHGYIAEYLIGSDVSEGDLDEPVLEDIIRILCRHQEVEKIRQAQGGFEKYFSNEKRWEFITDDYFTDYPTQIQESSILQFRTVIESEPLYKNYVQAISQHKKAKIEAEAQAEAAKKIAELDKKKKEVKADNKEKAAEQTH